MYFKTELETKLQKEKSLDANLSGCFGRVTSILERLDKVERRFEGMEDRVTKLKMQMLKRQ